MTKQISTKDDDLENIMANIEPVAMGLSRSMSLRKHMSTKEQDPGSDSKHDMFFICGICKKVLLEPMECNKCDTPFCADCVEKWKKDNSQCPGKEKCSSSEYIPMHRFVKNLLGEHRFFCPVESCEYHKLQQVNTVKQTNERVNFVNLGMSYHEAL